jgi:hypothetical protein
VGLTPPVDATTELPPMDCAPPVPFEPPTPDGFVELSELPHPITKRPERTPIVVIGFMFVQWYVRWNSVTESPESLT